MIQSFSDTATEDLFHGRDTKAARTLAKNLWPVIRRKLDLVDAAHELRDLQKAPGNHLHFLKGDQRGRHAILANDQYRITFRFENGNAKEVRCEDYH